MLWPWSELGIAPTQNIVEIKRAYAKRLKTTRPDDDAAGYQELREAYDAALEQARRQAPHSGLPIQDDLAQKNTAPEQSSSPVLPAAPAAPADMADEQPWTTADDGFSASSHSVSASSQNQVSHADEAEDAPAWSSADDGFSASSHSVSASSQEQVSHADEAEDAPAWSSADDGFSASSHSVSASSQEQVSHADEAEDAPAWSSADDGFSTSAHGVPLPAPISETEDAEWTVSDDGFSVTLNLPASPDQNELHLETPEQSHDGEAPDYATPEEIARGVYHFWQEHGDENLIALWPRVRYDLDAMPLLLRPEASNWMASLVLDFPDLPADFVRPLAAYFGWRDDFRVAAMLGAERTLQLYEHLHEIGIRGQGDKTLQHAFRHVRGVAEHLQQGRNWRARFLAVLMPGLERERWRYAPDELREAVEIPPQEAAGIDAVLRWHGVARVSGLILLCLLLGSLIGGDIAMAGYHTGFSIGIGVLALMGGLLHASVFERMHELLPERLLYWREHHPLLSTLGVLGACGALFFWVLYLEKAPADINMLSFFGTWAISLLLPLAIWPEGQPWRALLLPTQIILTLVLQPFMPKESALLAFILALAWVVLASALLRYRTGSVVEIYRNPFLWASPKQLWGWLLWAVFFKGVIAMAAILYLITLPLSLFVPSLRHGPWAGFATLSCATLIAFSLQNITPYALLIGLTSAIPLMAGIRWAAGKLAS